ncbi:MAG: hypothetical protein GX230_00720 [Lentisphaerae bacterium]|jgi:hypothetical protein|nr:hypothetical protein [Lentisphaerota bacterium]
MSDAVKCDIFPLKPDLLTSANGAAVTANNWPARRSELTELILPHQFGGLPPKGERTEVLCRARSMPRDMPGIRFHIYEVRVFFDATRSLSFTLWLWLPPGEGPFPVLLDGDGCWRYFHSPRVVQQIVARGNIAALIDRTEVAADNPPEHRKSGLYRFFPDAEFAQLSVWAWAMQRAVDALLTLPQVRTDAIAVTGHSRGGKTALLAGATDERIALTNPNCSGIGGAGLHRLKGAGSETINSFYGSGNIVWFGELFRKCRYRDAELPYDNHFLHAMVAPRLLLITDAYEDPGANPAGTYAACLDARRVFELLDAPQSIAWCIREGGHAHLPQDYDTLLDMMDRHFHGRTVKRNFQRKLFPELKTLLQSPKP